MNKYKTYEELKEELGDKFEEYMYKANIELLTKINKAIDYIEENGDLLYLASKCSIIYRDNIEVVAICDRLENLLEILKGGDKDGRTNERTS